jgi:hypothetical protein
VKTRKNKLEIPRIAPFPAVADAPSDPVWLARTGRARRRESHAGKETAGVSRRGKPELRTAYSQMPGRSPLTDTPAANV